MGVGPRIQRKPLENFFDVPFKKNVAWARGVKPAQTIKDWDPSPFTVSKQLQIA